MEMVKINKIPLTIQANILQLHFPDSKYFIKNDTLTWKGYLQPTQKSKKYLIKIEYQSGCHPNVYVLEPASLLFAEGKIELEHVYDTKTQKLCIYHRDGLEWFENMLIADSIIPWVSEWLLHYEIWVATGIWHGGGIH
jgi:hypothetical protein